MGDTLEETEDRETKRQKLIEPGVSLSWPNAYPKWNKENLETLGVSRLQEDASYCLVHKDHPVMALLRWNKNKLSCDIEAGRVCLVTRKYGPFVQLLENPDVNGVWVNISALLENCHYKIQSEMFKNSCDILRENYAHQQ
jgi:hypothetical protein